MEEGQINTENKKSKHSQRKISQESNSSYKKSQKKIESRHRSVVYVPTKMFNKVPSGKLPQIKFISPTIKRKKAAKNFSINDPFNKSFDLNLLGSISNKKKITQKKIEEKKIEPKEYTRKRNGTFYCRSKNVKINAAIERLMKNKEEENSYNKKSVEKLNNNSGVENENDEKALTERSKREIAPRIKEYIKKLGEKK